MNASLEPYPPVHPVPCCIRPRRCYGVGVHRALLTRREIVRRCLHLGHPVGKLGSGSLQSHSPDKFQAQVYRNPGVVRLSVQQSRVHLRDSRRRGFLDGGLDIPPSFKDTGWWTSTSNPGHYSQADRLRVLNNTVVREDVWGT